MIGSFLPLCHPATPATLVPPVTSKRRWHLLPHPVSLPKTVPLFPAVLTKGPPSLLTEHSGCRVLTQLSPSCAAPRTVPSYRLHLQSFPTQTGQLMLKTNLTTRAPPVTAPLTCPPLRPPSPGMHAARSPYFPCISFLLNFNCLLSLPSTETAHEPPGPKLWNKPKSLLIFSSCCLGKTNTSNKPL